MNDPLDGHLKDDDRHDALVDHRMNATDDLNLDAKTGVNRGRHKNVTDDHSMDDDHHDALVGHHTNVTDDRNDLNLDVMRDGSHDHHMNDRLDDHSMDDDHHDALDGHHTNVTDDRSDLKTDGNHVNRNYAPRDLMMDGNLDAMSHHVKLMVYLSMSCDRMSHDRSQCDHQMKLRHDTNRMDGMNLGGKNPDGKMMMRHVNWWKSHCVDLTIDRECYYPKTDDQKMI
jgi:hypothetical protein